jgi:UPF0271 protein
MKEKIYVIDTSGFIAGTTFTDGRSITVPGVVDEIIDNNTRFRLDLLLDTGLKIETPLEVCLDIVKSAAVSTGDNSVLSKTDIDILAKALQLTRELNTVLITDDYAVQNVAASLMIQCQPATTSGIKKIIKWELRCTGCGTVVRSGIECPICASSIKRYRIK